MVNALTTLREDVATILSEAGINSIGYAETRFVPPVALIVPDDDYVSLREGSRFGHVNVALKVLLIGPRATEKVGAEQFDEMIITALKALSDEFEIVTVQSPGEVTVNDAPYFAAVITIEVEIKL